MQASERMSDPLCCREGRPWAGEAQALDVALNLSEHTRLNLVLLNDDLGTLYTGK